MDRGKSAGKYSSPFFRFVVWVLVCAFLLPAPATVAAATGENPANAHVLRRLNSPERQAAVEEAARLDAAAREEFARSEAAEPQSVTPKAAEPAQRPVTVAEKAASPTASPDAFRPKSMTEVLFNYAAGFAGVPGLAPQRGVDGSLDEGLGFHQDGTARRAGGVAGTSGPSANGYRARAYMQSGFQNGYGMSGYGAGFGQSGLYGEMHDDLWGRNDPTTQRGGGRIGAGGSYSRELGDFDPFNIVAP